MEKGGGEQDHAFRQRFQMIFSKCSSLPVIPFYPPSCPFSPFPSKQCCICDLELQTCNIEWGSALLSTLYLLRDKKSDVIWCTKSQ